MTDATMNHSQGWHFIRVGRLNAPQYRCLLDTHFAVYLTEQTEYESEPLDYLGWWNYCALVPRLNRIAKSIQRSSCPDR
jgi:hypothetical protein